ncbi:MAG: hypothetical protein ACREMB_13735 [Candidatus Rokuibacteriota bacterium]
MAAAVGVRSPDGGSTTLTFPGGRRRVLATGRMLQAKGRPLEAWWLGSAEGWQTALVCEGESDSLAALTALRGSPEIAGLRSLPVVCVPGAGFPAERLVAGLAEQDIASALLAFDPDEPGRAYGARVAEALFRAGIRSLPVGVPEPDLAGWLASLPAGERGNQLAHRLCDAELSAPTAADFERRREIAYHRERLAELQAGTT